MAKKTKGGASSRSLKPRPSLSIPEISKKPKPKPAARKTDNSKKSAREMTRAYRDSNRGYRDGKRAGSTSKRTVRGEGSTAYQSGYKKGKREGVAARRAARRK